MRTRCVEGLCCKILLPPFLPKVLNAALCQQPSPHFGGATGAVLTINALSRALFHCAVESEAAAQRARQTAET